MLKEGARARYSIYAECFGINGAHKPIQRGPRVANARTFRSNCAETKQLAIIKMRDRLTTPSPVFLPAHNRHLRHC